MGPLSAIVINGVTGVISPLFLWRKNHPNLQLVLRGPSWNNKNQGSNSPNPRLPNTKREDVYIWTPKKHTIQTPVHLRKYDWKTTGQPENWWLEADPFLFGWPIFRCKLAVSFREKQPQPGYPNNPGPTTMHPVLHLLSLVEQSQGFSKPQVSALCWDDGTCVCFAK